MDRNIFTEKDALAAQDVINEQRQREWARKQNEDTSAERPGMKLGGPEYPKPDEAITRLAKYIPAEALGLYLALAGIADSASIAAGTGRWWFCALLATTIVFNVLYLRVLWSIRRWSQVTVSSVALVVYALATGGPLVQDVPLYTPLAATIALTLATAFLAFFRPPEPSPRKPVPAT